MPWSVLEMSGSKRKECTQVYRDTDCFVQNSLCCRLYASLRLCGGESGDGFMEQEGKRKPAFTVSPFPYAWWFWNRGSGWAAFPPGSLCATIRTRSSAKPYPGSLQLSRRRIFEPLYILLLFRIFLLFETYTALTCTELDLRGPCPQRTAALRPAVLFDEPGYGEITADAPVFSN